MIALLSLLGIALSATFLIDVDGEDGATTESAGTSDSFDEGMEPRVSIDEALYFDEPLAVDGFYDLRDQVDVVSFAQDGNDEMLAGEGRDYLNGRGGDDQLFGGGGNDELLGEKGDDVLFGGDGEDTVSGHVGNDFLYGGQGDDILTAGDGKDALFGGDGDDQLSGNLGDDTLVGGAGQDTLMGGSGDDVLDGRDTDKDFLNGGAGDDRILAGLQDHINGGDGSDTIVVEQDADATVDDFDPNLDFVELEYEGDTPPDLSMQKTETGISLLADGEVILAMDDVQDFDLSWIKLVRV